MVNNNSTQSSSVVTGTVKESTVYLKKSELPKNVSAFKNDALYISSSSLSLWMKEHSYISKDEIDNLISQANLLVVDSINKSSDSEAISRLDKCITHMEGEIIELKDKLTSLGADKGFITSDKENKFATKIDISNVNSSISSIKTSVSQIEAKSEHYLTDQDGYATQEWVNDKNYITEQQAQKNYASKKDIPDTSGFALKKDIPDVNNLAERSEIPSLEGYATQEWVKNQKYLTSHQSLKGYARLSDLPDTSRFITEDDIPSLEGYATQEWVKNQKYITSLPNLNEYAKKSDLPDTSRFITKEDIPELDSYATQEWIEDQGYITALPDLSIYAKKSDLPDTSRFITEDDIPSLEGYATQEWVKNQGYGISEQQDLSNYVKKSDLPDTSRFITKEDIPELGSYATQEWVKSQKYLTSHQSLKGYARLSDLPDTSRFITKEDIPELDSYATREWIEDQGYVKSLPDLSIYAKKSDLPDTSRFITKKDIPTIPTKVSELENDAKYISETQILDGYVQKSTLNDYVKTSSLSDTLSKYALDSNVYDKSEIQEFLDNLVTKEDADSSYASRTDVKQNYLTKINALQTFLRIEDYRGIKDAVTINNSYKNSSLSELKADIDTLMNGFYIVNYDDVIIVKDHQIINMFNDGMSTPVVTWIEE